MNDRRDARQDAENAPSEGVDGGRGSVDSRGQNAAPDGQNAAPDRQTADPPGWTSDHDRRTEDLEERPRGGQIGERIRRLAESATREADTFESPTAPPDDERAIELLREGFGPTVWVYVEGHTGDRNRRFSRAELALLQRAMNDWLELYARCYGVELDAAFTVREAAQLLVETRNVRETAQLLTRVPER